MQRKVTVVCFPLLCAVSTCGATTLSIPPLPSAEYDDTEMVTNAALPAVDCFADNTPLVIRIR